MVAAPLSSLLATEEERLPLAAYVILVALLCDPEAGNVGDVVEK